MNGKDDGQHKGGVSPRDVSTPPPEANHAPDVPPLFSDRPATSFTSLTSTSRNMSLTGQWLHPDIRTFLLHALKQLEDNVKYYWSQGWNLLTMNNVLTIGVVVVIAVFLSHDEYYQRYLKGLFLYYFSGVVRVESMTFSDIAAAMVMLLCVCFCIICLLSTCLSGSFPGQSLVSATSTYSIMGPRHIEGCPLEDGSCGIENLGNSCYMSSTLQCLSHIPDVTLHFLSGRFENDLNTENPMGSQGKMAMAYAELLKSLWSNKYRSVSPAYFQDEFISLRPQFERQVQQDAQEFLGALLDGLHEDLNQSEQRRLNEELAQKGGESCRRASCDQGQSEELPRHRASTGTLASQIDTMSSNALEERSKTSRSIISEKFYGQLCCKTRCPRCEHNSVKFDSFSVLTLPLPEPLYILRNRVILPIPANCDLDDLRHLDLFLRVRLEDTLSRCQRLIAALCGLDNSYAIDSWVVEGGIPVKRLDPQEQLRQYSAFQPHIVHQIRYTKATAEHTKIVHKHYFLYKKTPDSRVGDGVELRYTYTGIPYIYYLQEDTRAGEIFQAAVTYAQSVWHAHCLDTGITVPFESVRPNIKLLQDLDLGSEARLMGNERIIPKNTKIIPRNKAPFVVIEWGYELLNSEDVSQLTQDRPHTLVHPLLRMMPFQLHADLIIHSPKETHSKFGYSFGYEEVVENRENALSFERDGRRIGDGFLEELRLFERNEFGPQEITVTSLHHCLANFQSEEELSADNRYTCEHCRNPVMARRSLLLWSTPDVLIILLKRFIYVDDYGTISKDNMLVEYPLKDLDLTDWIEGGADRKLQKLRNKCESSSFVPVSAKYDLCGVVMHTGSLTRGHYTAYVENPLSGSWHLYNDHLVERVAAPLPVSAGESDLPGVDLEQLESILHTDAAYVLVYKRQGSVGSEVDNLRSLLKSDPERLLSMHPEHTGVK
eukprot:gb/GECG01007487.1/.p1 GENE.gb/GECG01007487.1/~~gb/GECG01007487.1/.p1  ORF type:complete len:941 (+),score=70.38 gb/GECG01007487.1/:1-2823(+)